MSSDLIVNTDAESQGVGAAQETDNIANTQTSLKVLVTKQHRSGDQVIENGSTNTVVPLNTKMLNESSEMSKIIKKTSEVNIRGTPLLNEGSDVNLSDLGASQSTQRVLLPQIKSLNPIKVQGAFSSANLKTSKWAKGIQNNLSQPISAKHLLTKKSKPFNKAIIEEVTKEHFFTKGDQINRRSSADMTETSFGTNAPNIRLRNGRN